MDYKDYYATLGIAADADEQAIRSAFRRLARVHHPDVAADKEGATERFKEINEAYTVLSDPEKRRTYDLFRSRYERYQTSYRQPQTETPRPSPGSASGSRPSSTASRPGPTPTHDAPHESKTERSGDRRTNTRTFSDEDFERLFRGFMWAYTAAAARNGQRGGSTASSDFSDFFEALFGNRRSTSSPGRTAAPDSTEVRQGRDIEVAAQITLEEAYRGTTRTLTYADGRKVEVTIPAGVQTGSKLRVRGQGERLMGRSLGDLYMTVEVQPHPVFVREGNDLKIRVSVPFEMAAQSGEIQIPSMDRPVHLKIPAGTRAGQLFRLRGQGMPTVANPSLRGDLVAQIDVQAPPHAQANTKGAASSARRAGESTKPQSGSRRKDAAKTGASQTAGRVRQALGLAVTALSLLVLTSQALMVPSNGWLWVASLAVVLLTYALVGRSLWAGGLGLLATAGCVWLLTQANLTAVEALQQAWPLLPTALGVGLLSARPKAKSSP